MAGRLADAKHEKGRLKTIVCFHISFEYLKS